MKETIFYNQAGSFWNESAEYYTERPKITTLDLAPEYISVLVESQINSISAAHERFKVLRSPDFLAQHSWFLEEDIDPSLDYSFRIELQFLAILIHQADKFFAADPELSKADTSPLPAFRKF